MKQPSPGSTAAAALGPLAIFCVGLFVWLFLVGGPRGLLELLQRGGFFGWITGFVVLLVAAGLAVGGALIAGGNRIPSFVLVAVAVLPWVVGLAGTFVGQGLVNDALAVVNPGDAGRLYLAGTGETMSTRAFGAFGAGLGTLSLAVALLVGDRTRWPSALLCAALAVAAFASALAALALTEGLSAVSFADPSQKATLLAGGLSRAVLFGWARLAGGGLLLVAAVIGAAFGQRRAGVIVGVLIGLGVLGGDEAVLQRARDGAERIADQGQIGGPDFQPVIIDGGRESRPNLVMDRTGRITSIDTERRPSAPALDSLLGPGGTKKTVRVAVDRRTPGRALLTMFDQAAERGDGVVELVGGSRPPPTEVLLVLRDDAPFLRLAAGGGGSVRVLTRAAVAEDSHAKDPNLFHAELTSGARSLSVRTRPNAPSRPFAVDLENPQQGTAAGATGRLIRLRLDPGITAEELVRAAVALTRRGDEVMVISGTMPGNPEGPAETRSSALGLGALGLLGTGSGVASGKGGFGEGAFGMKRSNTVAGETEAKGSLPKAVIRRVMRQRMNTFKYCYEKRLQAIPELSGKIVVAFTIGTDGRVVAARIDSSTLKDERVEACVGKATKRLRFPKPKGGVVVVRYPLVFKPG